MAVCQYFLRGACKFGNNCRFEHPAQKPSGFGSNSWSNPNTSSNNSGKVVAFTLDSITRDLTPNVDKPLWPLSSYGPAKNEVNVISGLDESPEELRVRAVAALRSGNAAEYQNYEAQKLNAAFSTLENALRNVSQVHDQALKTSMSGSNAPPSAPSSGGFGSFAGKGTSAFGSNNAFGSNTSTSAFGKSAFGSSAFGQVQPQASTSVFGQPSKPTSSVFGQPSTTTSAFGQPQTSVFGQSSFNKPVQSVFGSSNTSNSFNAFANNNNNTNSAAPSGGAFGNTGNGGAFSAFSGSGNNAFGSNSMNNNAPAFGQGGFGNQTTNAPQSVFGTNNNNTNNTSVFGGGTLPPKPVSVFGSSNPPASAFGGNSAPSNPISVFRNNSPSNTTSVFGQPSQPVSAFGSGSTFGSSAAPAPTTNSSFGSTHVQKAKSTYVPPDFKSLIANFKCTPGTDKYDDLLPPNYVSLLPSAAKKAFESDHFEWNKIPDLIPPKEYR